MTSGGWKHVRQLRDEVESFVRAAERADNEATRLRALAIEYRRRADSLEARLTEEEQVHEAKPDR